jgi:hypothetical protein
MAKISLVTIPLQDVSRVESTLSVMPGTILRWAITQVDPPVLEVVVLQ